MHLNTLKANKTNFCSIIPKDRAGLRGGHFGQVPGAPRFRGPHRFFGPRGSLWPHVFGTALHGFGRTYHICSGHHVLISNINRVPFCVIIVVNVASECRKSRFRGSRFQNLPGDNPPGSPFNSCAFGAGANHICNFQLNKQLAVHSWEILGWH